MNVNHSEELGNPIPKIQTAKHSGRLQFSDHALSRMIERGISVQRVEEALDCSSVDIIENYYPSSGRTTTACLILGVDGSGTYLHVVVAYPIVEVFTSYEPLPPYWSTPRIRGGRL
jgi:hypothetical protein